MLEFFPNREIAFTILGWSVHWYGLLYLIAFLLSLLLLPVLQKLKNIRLNFNQWTELVSVAAVGVIAGGRMGYIILYEPLLLIEKPLQSLAIWKGGMSSHGGFIGVALAVWLYVRYFMPPQKNRHSSRAQMFLSIMDLVVIPAALGLSLGRVGNIINRELFPGLEAKIMAVGSGVIISASCYIYLRRFRPNPGSVLSLFLILYSIFRIFIEFFRAQNYSAVIGMTRGQLYTVPLLLAGIVLAVYVMKDKHKTNNV